MLHEPVFNLKGKSVWVAGETGMVGRSIFHQMQNEDVDIISAPHAKLDLTNQEQTFNWLKSHRPDVVIMAAGKVGGIGANQAQPADFLYDNLAMVQNVIHGAFQADVQKLLYLGSSCIYPKHADQPIKETALLTGPLEPTNEAYAIAKISGLKLCQYYRQQYGCDFISVMPTNLYGPYDHFDPDTSHVLPALISKIHQTKIDKTSSISVWGTGKPLREFLYSDDLAEGLIHVLKYYSDDLPLNIGSGEEISIADLAKTIADVIGYNGNIIFDTNKPDGTPRKFLDSSRINSLGWKPKTPLNKGIEKVYAWYLNQH